MRDAPNALKYINVYPPYNARLECTSILHYTEIQPGVSDGNTEYRHGLCGQCLNFGLFRLDPQAQQVTYVKGVMKVHLLLFTHDLKTVW